MRKISKVILVIGLFMLLLLFFFGMIATQQAVHLPFYLIPLAEYPWIGSSMNMFIFWLSAGFACFTILAIIVVLLFPKRSDCLIIKHQSGNLEIQKKALEHFVVQKAEETDFIHQPSAKIKIVKNKVSVKLDGEMKQTTDIAQKQERLVTDISGSLQQLFGVESNIQTEVILKDAETKPTTHEQPRVV
ncbi:alkaline shock response membrane anchor protein AmaP [Enterococcus sp. DIV0876]|uniref:alkaline shock response membrane anchor protein AmaP n=1 Tax=Enterococcus sp. DIV0876 TaxID=2774633 RepID=UPI003D2FE8F8